MMLTCPYSLPVGRGVQGGGLRDFRGATAKPGLDSPQPNGSVEREGRTHAWEGALCNIKQDLPGGWRLTMKSQW